MRDKHHARRQGYNRRSEPCAYVHNGHNGEPVFSTAIHHDLNISRATVSGLIKKLRAGGYLSYEGSDDDERHKKIIATEKAYTLQQDICDCLKKIETMAFRNFTDQELDEMERLQKKMIDNTI